MDEKNTARYKSKLFAVRIIKLAKYLREQYKEYSLADQILLSGTSIGANLAESECAISKADFLSKVYIALKETAETAYWLDLLNETNMINDKMYDSLINDCAELKKMLSSTTKTIKERSGKNAKELNSQLSTLHS